MGKFKVGMLVEVNGINGSGGKFKGGVGTVYDIFGNGIYKVDFYSGVYDNDSGMGIVHESAMKIIETEYEYGQTLYDYNDKEWQVISIQMTGRGIIYRLENSYLSKIDRFTYELNESFSTSPKPKFAIYRYLSGRKTVLKGSECNTYAETLILLKTIDLFANSNEYFIDVYEEGTEEKERDYFVACCYNEYGEVRMETGCLNESIEDAREEVELLNEGLVNKVFFVRYYNETYND